MSELKNETKNITYKTEDGSKQIVRSEKTLLQTPLSTHDETTDSATNDTTNVTLPRAQLIETILQVNALGLSGKQVKGLRITEEGEIMCQMGEPDLVDKMQNDMRIKGAFTDLKNQEQDNLNNNRFALEQEGIDITKDMIKGDKAPMDAEHEYWNKK